MTPKIVPTPPPPTGPVCPRCGQPHAVLAQIGSFILSVPLCEKTANAPEPETVQLPDSATPPGDRGTPRTGGSLLAWPGTTYTTVEHCQYCGNSWTATRTVGTPRLDAVPCPKCRRLV